MIYWLRSIHTTSHSITVAIWVHKKKNPKHLLELATAPNSSNYHAPFIVIFYSVTASGGSARRLETTFATNIVVIAQ